VGRIHGTKYDDEKQVVEAAEADDVPKTEGKIVEQGVKMT
jgi:hypothetical protein